MELDIHQKGNCSKMFLRPMVDVMGGVRDSLECEGSGPSEMED